MPAQTGRRGPIAENRPSPLRSSGSGTLTAIRSTDRLRAGHGSSDGVASLAWEATGRLLAPFREGALCELFVACEGDLDYSLISDEAGRGYSKSFTGAFVGMACHDISGRRQPADFEFFEYLERLD
jgi:Beta xylosidase C-terminal Concanavalin A-like domain